MAAYVRDLIVKCAFPGCRSGARVEVFNTWNSSLGFYCRRHGAEYVKRLNRETKLAEVRARHTAEEPAE